MQWYIQKDARLLIAFNALVGIAVLLWVMSLKDDDTGERWKMRSISEMVLRNDDVGSPRIAFAFQIALLTVTVWQCLEWYICRAKAIGAEGSVTGIWVSFAIAAGSSVSTAVLTIAKQPTGHIASATLMFLSYWLCLCFLTRYLYHNNSSTRVWSVSVLLAFTFAAAVVFVVAGEPVFEYVTVLLSLVILWLLSDAGRADCFKVSEPVIVLVKRPHELRL